jgi:hypothetical protein
MLMCCQRVLTADAKAEGGGTKVKMVVECLLMCCSCVANVSQGAGSKVKIEDGVGGGNLEASLYERYLADDNVFSLCR